MNEEYENMNIQLKHTGDGTPYQGWQYLIC